MPAALAPSAIVYFERMATEYPGKRLQIVRALAEADFVVGSRSYAPGSRDVDLTEISGGRTGDANVRFGSTTDITAVMSNASGVKSPPNRGSRPAKGNAKVTSAPLPDWSVGVPLETQLCLSCCRFHGHLV